MSDTLTIHEIEAVLDAFWEDTGRWDPWTNGLMDRELEGLDPSIPVERDKRVAIVRQHDSAHEVMVGARTACTNLRQRFRDATGTPDPIQEVFAESWKRLSAYFDAGGKVDDLTFGPIEIIPDKVP